MKGERATSVLVAMILLVIVLGPTALGKSDPTDANRYLNAVQEFADNVLVKGGVKV